MIRIKQDDAWIGKRRKSVFRSSPAQKYRTLKGLKMFVGCSFSPSSWIAKCPVGRTYRILGGNTEQGLCWRDGELQDGRGREVPVGSREQLQVEAEGGVEDPIDRNQPTGAKGAVGSVKLEWKRGIVFVQPWKKVFFFKYFLKFPTDPFTGRKIQNVTNQSLLDRTFLNSMPRASKSVDRWTRKHHLIYSVIRWL